MLLESTRSLAPCLHSQDYGYQSFSVQANYGIYQLPGISIRLINSKYLLPAYVVLGGSIYFSVLLLLRAIKAQDVQLLDEYLGTRFRFIARPLKRLVANPSRDVSSD